MTQFPLLPLRDIVVFPGMVVPLFVGRDKSVAALESAMEGDKDIFLLAQLDPKDLVFIDETGITTVFSERLVSPRLSRTLADDMGITTAVLDPIEGLSDQTAEEDYISLMEQNLASLQKANACP